MIRPLRQRHRHLMIALGILLPVAFGAGLAARRPIPGSTGLPQELAQEQSGFKQVVWDRADLWTQPPIRTRLLASRADGKSLAIELSASREIVKPDLLIYWVTGKAGGDGSLPENAALIGAFVQEPPVALPMPAGTDGENGVFLLYSLADHAVVAISKPVNLMRQ